MERKKKYKEDADYLYDEDGRVKLKSYEEGTRTKIQIQCKR